MNRSLILYGLSIVFSLTIIGSYVYYDLGGFDDIDIYVFDVEERVVAGREFMGRSNSPLIVEYLNEARSLLEDRDFNGEVMRVVYQNDTLPFGEVHYFIGIGMEGEMAEVPDGLEVRQFSGSQKLAIFLSMSHWVRPSADTVDELMKTRADSLGLNLAPFLFEIYYSDDSMSIENWLNEDQAASSSD